jgi:hypothetical protein
MIDKQFMCADEALTVSGNFCAKSAAEVAHIQHWQSQTMMNRKRRLNESKNSFNSDRKPFPLSF